MRIACVVVGERSVLAVRRGDRLLSVAAIAPELPRTLPELLALGPEALATLRGRLEEADASACIPEPVTYLPLSTPATKMFCLGLNYRAHAAEAAYDEPSHPVVFSRTHASFCGHGQPMVLPRCSPQFDFEAELAVVIGRRARGVSKEDALSFVAGYTLFNDGSVRDRQKRTHQWTLGKNFDLTGPLGPELVTADELPAGATGLRIQMRVNGETMQDANTRDMIFSVADAIAAVTEGTTLEPGDIIAMGTPSGVGAARTPPFFLKDGDVCEVEVEKVGVLSNPVSAERAAEEGGRS